MGRNWYADWEAEKERREEEYWEEQQREEKAKQERERQEKLDKASPDLKTPQLYYIPTGNGREQLSFLPPIEKEKKGKNIVAEKNDVSEELKVDDSQEDENGAY